HLALSLRREVRPADASPLAGRSFGGQDRHDRRSHPAHLLPLRLLRRPVQHRGDESHARRWRVDRFDPGHIDRPGAAARATQTEVEPLMLWTLLAQSAYLPPKVSTVAHKVDFLFNTVLGIT